MLLATSSPGLKDFQNMGEWKHMDVDTCVWQSSMYNVDKKILHPPTPKKHPQNNNKKKTPARQKEVPQMKPNQTK